MTAVYKDFLPEPHYRVIRDLFLTEKLPWHYNDRVVSTERHFMFTHAFMDNGRVINPHYGTTQTDTDTRVVINFNLRTRE